MANIGRTTIGTHAQLPLSRAIHVGDTVYCSGQVPVLSTGEIVPGGIREQVKFVMDQVGEVLESAGATMADVVKVNVILTDPADFAAFNEIYRGYFPVDPPARTTICAALLVDARVEVDVVAIVGAHLNAA